MKVFELDIPSDRGLTNFDLISYIGKLGVPYFRGVFMRNELPDKKHLVECGIMMCPGHRNPFFGLGSLPINL